MSTKHTPAPWILDKPDKLRRTIITAADGIVTIMTGVEDADAQLMAAAPELLAACEAAKKFLEPELKEPGATVFWQLVGAIKQAKGMG